MLKKRLGKKGFTLVEIIVVLVILAILAAIMIPSMIGWIDKANDKSDAIAGRTLLLAAQTIVSENYGTGKTLADTAAMSAANDLASIKEDITAWDVSADGVVNSVSFTGKGGDRTFTNGGGLNTITTT